MFLLYIRVDGKSDDRKIGYTTLTINQLLELQKDKHRSQNHRNRQQLISDVA